MTPHRVHLLEMRASRPGATGCDKDSVEAMIAAGDAIGTLSALLKASGARCTMDPRRNVTHPCWRCGTSERPRDLIAIGTYTRPMGGNIQPCDTIERPMCAECAAATTAEPPADATARHLAEMRAGREVQGG